MIMIKRVLSTFLAALMICLWGCSEKTDPEIKSSLESAIESVNGESRLECDYMLEITFGERSVLYYAKGDTQWDRAENRFSMVYDRTLLGESSKMESYFADGKMQSVINGKLVAVNEVKTDVLSTFPNFKIPACYGEADISVSDNSSGKAYKFIADDTKKLCEAVIGDIYSLATVIKKPQPEKTKYGEAQCVYTVKEGRVVSVRYEFDVKLFDTPAATANYTPPESEYTLDLHVVAKLEYTDFGDEVEISCYTPEESADESSADSENESEESADGEKD